MQPEFVFFDLDDTLVASTIRTKRPYSIVELMPGVFDKLSTLRAKGTQIAIITNQRGVAFGFQTETDVRRKFRDVKDALKLADDTIFKVCYSDPRNKDFRYRKPEDCARAKPSGQMIIEVMFELHITDRRLITFVGDSPDDYAAAGDAGVSFCYAETFFEAPNTSRALTPFIPGYELTPGSK